MYTPGPWFITPIPNTTGYDVVAQSGRSVARFMSADDAALIHAATDLLAACEGIAMFPDVRNYIAAQYPGLVKQIDAAIAKVKGGTP